MRSAGENWFLMWSMKGIIKINRSGVSNAERYREEKKEMKALSLMQPWAWAVVKNLKPIENRKWPTKYRGEILIHASMTYDPMGEIILRENGIEVPARPLLSYGALIGKVTIMDCVKWHPSEFFFGPWGFVLKDAVEFEEVIPYKGKLGIFTVPDEILKEMGGAR